MTMKYTDIPILMYHEISTVHHEWCLAPAEFTAQMKFLHEQGYKTISLSQLHAGILHHQETAEKLVVITFDDGRKGVYTYAYPLLRQLGFTATIYIVPQWIDGIAIPALEHYSDFLTWEELQELSRHGFEIGSHSFSHPDLTKLAPAAVREELFRAEQRIQEKIGKKVNHFSYPYGLYTTDTVALSTERYLTAVTTHRGFDKSPGGYARQWITPEVDLVRFQRLLVPPTISLCMIVKNEERFLEEGLRSVQGLVDEMIIIDTGSTDRTKEIAHTFTDKVYDYQWGDDFAAARNESLRSATKDWILILDADEVMDVNDHNNIKQALNNWDIDGYRIVTYNYNNDSSISGWHPASASPLAKSFLGWYPSLKVRLFQRRPGILFAGQVHEMVDTSILARKGTISTLPVPVHHYGAQRGASTSYFELTQKKIAQHPDDAKAYYELGIQYKEQGKFAEAEAALTQSLTLDPLPITPQLNLALVQQKQGQYDLAIYTYESVLARSPAAAEAYFGLGYCYFQKQELEKALHYFQQATIYNQVYVDAYINIGALYEKLGRYPDALVSLQKALAIAPRHPRANYNIGVVYEKRGYITEAIQYYTHALELNYIRKEEVRERIRKLQLLIQKSESSSH